MALSVSCPGCQAVYPVSESLIGKTIRCKKCGETMPVSAPVKAAAPAAAEIIEDDEAPTPRTKPSRRRDDDEDDLPKSKPSRRRDEEEDEEVPTPKSKRRVAEDEDEEVPTPKSKRRARADEDDEDDDRPSRRGGVAAPKSKMPLLLGGLAAVVLLGGGIAAAVMMSGDGDKPDNGNPQPITNVTPQPDFTPKPDTLQRPDTTPKVTPKVTPKSETPPKPEAPPKVEIKPDPKAVSKVEEVKPAPAPTPEEVKPAPTPNPKPEDGGFKRRITSSGMSTQDYFNGSISDFDMDLCTKASVFIKCETDTGAATGSGWFGVAPGLVFTNAHVIDMKAPNSSEPRKLTFYLNSGTPQQREIPHSKIKILAVDRDIDLAVLQIVGEPDLPTPMKVKPSAELKLGQSILTIGFPLGARANRITGSKSEPSVSVRKTSYIGQLTNEFGQLRRVKTEGGINPGNSGGAVIDAEGVVVGVVVEIYNGGAVGNYIGLLVPTEYVIGLVAGRVGNLEYGIAYNDNGKVKLPVTANILNPMKKAMTVRVRSWVGDVNAKYRPPSMTKPTTDPNDAGEQDIEMKYDEKTMKATGELVFPVPPAGRTYWAQAYYTNSLTTYSLPGIKLPISGPPIDRVPANLTAAPKEGARRTVTMSNSSALDEEFEGEGESKNEKVLTKKSLTVQETVVKPDKTDARQLARLQLRFDSFSIAFEQNGIALMEISKKEQEQYLAFFKAAAAFGLVNRFGEVFSYTLDIVGVNDPIANFIVSFVSQGALEALSATSIPMPNKVMNPNDTWTTTKDVRWTHITRPQPGLALSGGKNAKAKAQEFKYRDQITYTYLGTREKAGRKEAVISVSGKSIQAPNVKETVSGSVKGTIWVEPDTGVVIQAEIEKEFELDTSREGQKRKLSGLNTYKIERGTAQ